MTFGFGNSEKKYPPSIFHLCEMIYLVIVRRRWVPWFFSFFGRLLHAATNSTWTYVLFDFLLLDHFLVQIRYKVPILNCIFLHIFRSECISLRFYWSEISIFAQIFRHKSIFYANFEINAYFSCLMPYYSQSWKNSD